MSFSYIDLFIALPLAFFAYRGFIKGLIVEVASLVALVLGIYGAVYFSGYAQSLLSQHLDFDEGVLKIIAFVVTFLIVIIVVHLIGKIVEKIAEAVALGAVNKILGLVFGLIKGAFLISVLLYLINTFTGKTIISDEDCSKSYLCKPVSVIAPAIFIGIGDFDIDSDSVDDAKKKVKSTTSI